MDFPSPLMTLNVGLKATLKLMAHMRISILGLILSLVIIPYLTTDFLDTGKDQSDILLDQRLEVAVSRGDSAIAQGPFRNNKFFSSLLLGQIQRCVSLIITS